jgi:membrane-associated phospholipid phosphatase
MKKTITLFIFLSLFSSSTVIASLSTIPQDVSIQLKEDTISPFWKRTITPASLIGLGLLANNSSFEKELQSNLRNRVGNNFEFGIDDFLPFVPTAQMYLADLAGVEARNHWFDQSKYAFMSNLLSMSITYSIKGLAQKTRPNGEAFAFPSGHTTFAFTNATVLLKEFQDSSPILAYSGYLSAISTGAFRMINNKHWISDVLAGAGIGILATELIYHFEPLKNWNPFLKKKDMTLLPQLDVGYYGFYYACRIL